MDRSFIGFAQERFELGKDLLDRIEVWRVRRQEEEPGAGAADRLSDGLALVTAEIVHDHDVSRQKRRGQDLFDIGKEACAVDRSVDHARSFEPVGAQCRQEGQRSPLAERDFGQETLAACASAVHAGHVGLGPGLVDEDEPRGIEPSLIALPALTPPFDVGTVLLGRVQAFF